MIAKVIAHGSTRDDALDRLAGALGDFVIDGVKTNIPFVLALLSDGEFRAGRVHTSLTADVLARVGRVAA